LDFNRNDGEIAWRQATFSETRSAELAGSDFLSPFRLFRHCYGDMMNHTAMQTANNDAELVAASISGDRQAFGHIVERYQNLICSVAYSATGSLTQSQDLAQETFLAAWTQLRSLREPMKLRAWLCGIARNLVNNSVRRSQREPTSVAQPLENVADAASREPMPVEAVISREEEAILWRSLEQIPELYREPLVLFYREHQSIERVAEALELSEDATKQRLSRGRKLLQEQVTAFVEGALRRSAPGRAFTLGVIAALPVLVTSATAATIGATAAKGTAAAKSAAGLGLLGAVLGPILGILGGYLGSKFSIENTKSPRERQFMVKMSWIAALLAVVFTVALGLLTFNAKALISSHPALFVGSLIILIMGYVVVLFGLIYRSNRRQQQIRREEAAKLGSPELEAENAEQKRRGFEFRSKACLLGLPLVHVKLGNALGQRPVGFQRLKCAHQLVHNRLRRLGGRQEAEPDGAGHLRASQFRHRRDVRHRLHALGIQRRQCNEFAVLHVLLDRRDDQEHGVEPI